MQHRTTFKYLPLAICAALGAAAVPALAQDAQQLGTIVVQGEVPARELNPDADTERERLAAVPGATNLVEPQQEARLATLKDALNHQPGLVVQEFFGGLDQPRLNIRGSGIQSNPMNRGLSLLSNGLPMNEADGSFVIAFLEPRNARFISVRRGANALSAAATTLGGELDFSSLTGTQGDVLRLLGGSFGRFGGQVAKGFESGNLDGRISVTHDQYDGFRHFSDSRRRSVQGNFGVRGDGFENRTYLSWVDFFMNIPFVVTREQMHLDPTQVNGEGVAVRPPFNMIDVYKRRPHRNSSQLRLANRTSWGSARLNNSFGVYAQTIDDTFQNPLSSAATDGHTWGMQWQLAGVAGELEYRVALDWARSDMQRNLYTVNSQTGQWKTHFGDHDLQAETRNALFGVNWHFADAWSLVADARFSQAIRDARERLSGNSLDQDWSYASPRLGVVWQPAQGQRLFANLSRSNEAPTFWEIVDVGNLPNPMNDAVGVTSLARLDVQRADTLEVGGAGALGGGEHAPHWSLAVYWSEVSDELMSVTGENGTPAGTYNYRGGTRHRGVELGLDGSIATAGAQVAFDYRLAWTLGDFRFKDGEYAGNRIAGVPSDVFSGEVLMRVGGFSLGPSVYWMPTATETNHANVPGTRQDSYALLGFKAEYSASDRWSVWLRGDNLTDRTYASAFVVRGMAPPDAPTFLPGNGRGFSAGFRYEL